MEIHQSRALTLLDDRCLGAPDSTPVPREGPGEPIDFTRAFAAGLMYESGAPRQRPRPSRLEGFSSLDFDHEMHAVLRVAASLQRRKWNKHPL